MSIQFAPEPNPTANTLDLEEEQSTGPLALNFEFEFFGVHYSWFDLSTQGFITFGADSLPSCNPTQRNRFIPLNADLSNFIALGCMDVIPPGPMRIAYEVRGNAQRRRLVLSFTAIPTAPVIDEPRLTAQVVLHERTGMIDVYTTRLEAGGRIISQTATRFTTSPTMRARATA
jgi:hypothetical protein